MGLISDLLDAPGVATAVDAGEAEKLAGMLSRAVNIDVIGQSICGNEGAVYALGRKRGERMLLVCARSGATALGQFEGESRTSSIDGEAIRTLVCEADHAGAVAVREQLLWLRPQPIGLKKSFGFGDRLGLATPGHVRAVRNTGILPFFAQQSIREMTRSGRTPEVVMDDATWGMLEEGYTGEHGSDADHLKSAEDADVCLEAGFTFFTIDPGEHVDDAADSQEKAALTAKFERLPWNEMETTAADCRRRFLSGPKKLCPALTVEFTEESLVRAAVKYARAVLYTAKLYRHITGARAKDAFELEVSVDETETPTSVAEHYYIASELKRLGVRWVSLAPRFVGRFEKGVDYIGSLKEFEETFKSHVEVARHLGPYKLSLHSGSDKFSVYPIAAEHAGELIHVKTAGTSYLEALRVTARLEPALFREILGFAIERYEQDKRTYHVSAALGKVPSPDSLPDEELADLIDRFDARQVLHVTYGSVLMSEDGSGKRRFRNRLLRVLKENPEAHAAALEKHLKRHVEPFM